MSEKPSPAAPPLDRPDESIVRALASAPGDQGLWLRFFEKLRPAVYYSAYRACRGERELAADLTQEAFARFFKYADLKRFENDAHALAYLRQIARSRLHSEYARRPEAFGQSLTRDPTQANLSVAPDRAEELVEQTEALRDFAVLAQDLSADEHALLEKLIAGGTVADLARSFDISYGAAALRIHRLVNKIRKQFMHLRSGE